jgi:hypothetical protein
MHNDCRTPSINMDKCFSHSVWTHFTKPLLAAKHALVHVMSFR